MKTVPKFYMEVLRISMEIISQMTLTKLTMTLTIENNAII